MRAEPHSPEAAEQREPSIDPARARIIAGAGRRFFTHGFHNVTMDDLAGELGMSKKTLYSRFDTKLQLLDAVLDDKFHRARADLGAILAARRDFPETLRQYLDCLQRHTGELQPPFVRDMRQEGMDVYQKVERLRRECIQEFFGELMRQGRRDGFIRKDIPAHIIIEILLAAVQAIVNPARMDELDLTPKTGCALVTKVVLEGVIDSAARSNLKGEGKK